MKSHVKSKAFYKEAENMQTGWGRYLKKIDKLKDAVDNDSNITLDDACWILYGEGYTSLAWGKFRKFCVNKHWGKRKLPWVAWKALFDKQNI